jgi:hypothetical protein
MPMTSTPGYYKTCIDVFYPNLKGDMQHVASFQIYTGPTMTDAAIKLDEFIEKGEGVLSDSVKAYLNSLRNNDYELTLKVYIVANGIKVPRIQTLEEMEREDPDVFKNPE